MVPLRHRSASPRRRLLGHVARSQRPVLALAFGSGVVRQLGFLALPWCLQHAVDDGLVPGDGTTLGWWAGAVVLAAVVQVVGVCGWDWWANLVDGRVGIGLRRALAARVLEPDAPTRHGGVRVDGVGEGDLLLRGGRDVDQVRVWVHGLATWAVIGTTAVVLVPGLLSLSPLLLAVAAATVPCLVVIGVVHPRRYEQASREVAEAHAARADHVEHVLASAVTSRGIGGHRALADRHGQSSADLSRAAITATDRLARWQAWGVGVPTVAVAVGLLVGVLAVLDDRLTVGGLVAFSTWMGTIGVAVEVGLVRWAQTTDARVAADRLVSLLGTAPELRGAVPGEESSDRPSPEAVEVAGTTVRRGELVVLTGPTGGGKSTLLSRLAGVHGPRAVLVPQRPLVLSASVRENLTLGATVDDAALRAVLADVGLDGELDVDDTVADGAAGLSGGQVQRLALARALLTDAPLLLLDDVTSALDVPTERRVLAALRHRAADRVVVMASQRSGVVAAADRVVTIGVDR